MTQLSFESKLQRAEQHLHELDPKIKQWITSHPYRISDELDPDTGDNIIWGELLDPMPSIISHLIGDCLQNLRSTLDHLAYELAVANTGMLTDAQAITTAFPIFRYSKGFSSRGMNKLRYLSGRAQSVIERLQPYHASEPTKHILWLLEQLNNIDKHRRLLITIVHSLGAGVEHPLGARMEFFKWNSNSAADFSERRTEIARYRCSYIKGSPRVKVKFSPTLIVLFNDVPAEQRIVTPTLDNMLNFIRDVVVRKLRRLL